MAIFGALDLYSFYRGFPHLITMFDDSIPLSLLLISLLASGPLYMINHKGGYLLYYFQFPVRLIFFVMTFGFIQRLMPTQQGTFAHGMLLATIFGLEAVRLMLTIQKNKVNI